MTTQKEKFASVFSAGHTECKFYYSVDPISPYVGNSFAQTSLTTKRSPLSQKILFFSIVSLDTSNAVLATAIQNFCHKSENFPLKYRNWIRIWVFLWFTFPHDFPIDTCNAVFQPSQFCVAKNPHSNSASDKKCKDLLETTVFSSKPSPGQVKRPFNSAPEKLHQMSETFSFPVRFWLENWCVSEKKLLKVFHWTNITQIRLLYWTNFSKSWKEFRWKVDIDKKTLFSENTLFSKVPLDA